MFNYPFDKYHFYVGKNKIVAVSTYAGKTVRGVAKCDPRDKFDIEKGKALAAARCAERVATKRQARAKIEFNQACANFAKAQKRLEDMNIYMIDSNKAVIAAKENIDTILKDM
jgi:hypothetical protein